jgi:hypothetical protein
MVVMDCSHEPLFDVTHYYDRDFRSGNKKKATALGVLQLRISDAWHRPAQAEFHKTLAATVSVGG